MQSSSASPRARTVTAVSAPFHFQNALNDCAPACVLALADFYGVKADLRDIRARLCADPKVGVRVGAFAASLSELFAVEAGRLDTAKGVPETMVPFIAYLPHEKHYVVVWHADDRHVLIGDPGSGLHKVTMSELRQRWDGITLVLRPTGHSQQVGVLKTTKPAASSVVRDVLKNHWGPLASVSVTAFVQGATSTAFSILLPYALTDFRHLALLAVTFVGLSFGLGMATVTIASSARRRISRDAGSAIFVRLRTIDRGFYTIGDAFTRLQDLQNVIDVSMAFARDLPYVFAIFIGAAVFLGRVDWRLTVVLITLVIMLFVLLDPFVQAARSITYRLRLQNARLNNELRRTWEPDGTDAEYSTIWKDIVSANYKQTVLIAPASVAISQLLPGVILVFAVWELMFGGVEAGANALLLTILTILNYLVVALHNIYGSYVQWQSMEPAAHRLKDFMDH